MNDIWQPTLTKNRMVSYTPAGPKEPALVSVTRQESRIYRIGVQGSHVAELLQRVIEKYGHYVGGPCYEFPDHCGVANADSSA